MSDVTITDVVSVEFDERRWDLTIRVTRTNGTVEEFVASAASAFTGDSGIWFGTVADYDTAREGL